MPLIVFERNVLHSYPIYALLSLLFRKEFHKIQGEMVKKGWFMFLLEKSIAIWLDFFIHAIFSCLIIQTLSQEPLLIHLNWVSHLKVYLIYVKDIMDSINLNTLFYSFFNLLL
ncbi:hypothetical protein ACJX0J_032937, partial [Zea mays]